MTILSRAHIHVRAFGRTVRMLADTTRKYGFHTVLHYCRGVVASLVGPRNERHQADIWLSQRFHESNIYDVEHGINTGGVLEVGELGIDGRDALAAGNYAPTRPTSFRAAMSTLEDDLDRYTFVDLGSGKGRALLLASEYPFRQIIGVELSAQLHEIAQRNVRKYRSATSQCRDIRCICANAAAFDLPKTPLVLYLFSPFSGEVLSQVVDNIGTSYHGCPRDMYIVFTSIAMYSLDELEAGSWEHPLLERLDGFRRVGSGSSRNDYHVVYRAEPDG